MRVDPLTIAYIAIGAHEVIRQQPGGQLPDDVTDSFGGQLGFIESVIEGAEVLERASMEYDTDSLVWAYDVAESFGVAYATAFLDYHAGLAGYPVSGKVAHHVLRDALNL